MKKLAAILLTGILLFHWMGYQAVYSYWIQQADDKLETQLDRAEYNEQELITIAIPLHLPYLTDQAEYERLNGETVFNGITYKYVQRRVFHDSLFLQCLPNQEAMRLSTARNDCFKFTTGIQQNTSGFSKPGVAFIRHFTGGSNLISTPERAEMLLSGGRRFITISQTIPACTADGCPEQPPE